MHLPTQGCVPRHLLDCVCVCVCACVCVCVCVCACSGFKDIDVLETTKHCLNLGSYNYLGFAAADVYCTPRVQETIAHDGVSTCSPRGIAGVYVCVCVCVPASINARMDSA